MNMLVRVPAVLCLLTVLISADLSTAGTVHLGGGHGGGCYYGGYYGGFYGGWCNPYPYYYSYYPGYYYSGYYSYDPGYSPSSLGQAYSPSGPSYDELGRFWGRNLKNRTGTQEQLVAFMRSDLLKASETSQNLFRGGFLKTYKDGLPALNRAIGEAKGSPPEPTQPKG